MGGGREEGGGGRAEGGRGREGGASHLLITRRPSAPPDMNAALASYLKHSQRRARMQCSLQRGDVRHDANAQHGSIVRANGAEYAGICSLGSHNGSGINFSIGFFLQRRRVTDRSVNHALKSCAGGSARLRRSRISWCSGMSRMRWGLEGRSGMGRGGIEAASLAELVAWNAAAQDAAE